MAMRNLLLLLLLLLLQAFALSAPACPVIALLLGQVPAASSHKQELDEQSLLHQGQQLRLAAWGLWHAGMCCILFKACCSSLVPAMSV
jgi:hypothetical protein